MGIQQAVQCLTRWRHVIGNAAGHVVLQHLNKKATANKSIESIVTQLLTGHVFVYKELKVAGPSEAFMSPLILSLLGLTHLQDTLGWVEVPGLNLDAKCNYGIKGVLALCTVAVSTNFILWHHSND